MQTDHSAFAPLTSAWLNEIGRAQRFKDARFTKDAQEGMQFFSGPYEFWFRKPDHSYFDPGDGSHLAGGRGAVVTVNKVAEMVQLFGPALYHQNPTRRTTPETPTLVDPAALGVADQQGMMAFQQAVMMTQTELAKAQARATLYEAVLNFTPERLNLETHVRMAVDEAIIKGAAPLWTEVYRLPGGTGQKLVGTFWDTVDDLLLDPDAKSLETLKWIARRCKKPAWEVEREYGLPPGYLKNAGAHDCRQTGSWTSGQGPEAHGEAGVEGMVTYYKVYSKMGVGGRIPGAVSRTPGVRPMCELFGDFCLYVACEGVRHPLNCPPWVYDGTPATDFNAGRAAMQWPVPFWRLGRWPMELIHFHTIPGDPWPMSHLSPGMGELQFMNWVFSKITEKIKVTSRMGMFIPQDAPKSIEDWFHSGRDLEIIRYANQSAIPLDKLFGFVQFPEWNKDIWEVYERVAESFDKRVGLVELLYGLSGVQLRSAQEANIKSSNANLRPDDMAKKLEQSMGRVANSEMVAAGWLQTPLDVLPVLGPVGAYAWQKLIWNADPLEAIFGLTTRVESGTARRPNPTQFAESMDGAMNQLFVPLLQFAQTTGINAPVNALITDWAKSRQIQNPGRYLIPALPPMPAPAPAGGPAAK